MATHFFLRISALCFLTCSLQGCVNAVMSGAQAVYNRHSIQNSLSDHYIALKSERSIYINSDHFKGTRISVSAFNGVVLLAGQVNTQAQKNEAGRIVKEIADSNEVHNLITVSPPISSLTSLSDSWITAKIKSKFIAMNDIDPTQIKVITENGVVYLMGIIPHEQADIAVDLARSTDGVESVVKIFSYIRISKV